jgi:tetratricopeptide (TPR) repeat protein
MGQRPAAKQGGYVKRIKVISAIAGLVLATLCQRTARAQEAGFEGEVNAVAAAHPPDFERISSLAMSGEVEAANEQLVGLTQKDTSPALAFIAANMLYKMDPQASYDLHKKVYEAKPDERITALEWAMERHRKGEYAEAIPLYEKFLASKSATQYNALLAECLLRQGKLKEAVATWEAAGHPHQHTGIDFAICEIHGELSPLRRRSDLIQRVKKGEQQAASKLIDQDLHMDQDWWNSQISKDGLTQDLPLVEKLLGKETAKFKEIQCWVDIASLEEPQAETVKQVLKTANLIVEGGNLPESSLVAGRLIGIVLEQKIETREQMFGRYEKELTARAKSKEGDVEALNILSGLSIEKKTLARLAEYDRYGWERYGEFRFAGSLLAGLSLQGSLNSDGPDLKKALEQFPESGAVHAVELRCADKDHVTKEMLVSAIESEYHHLSPGMGAYPDSYTLKGYFFMLKQKL